MVNGLRVNRLVVLMVLVSAGRRRKAALAIEGELECCVYLVSGVLSDCGVCVSFNVVNVVIRGLDEVGLGRCW
jgi:hypothetical protein